MIAANNEQQQEGSDQVTRVSAARACVFWALAAMVTTALHRHGKFVRPAKRRDKQRNEHRDHALCPLKDIAALKVRATRHLRL